MREYIRSHQLRITPEQLALLVPCFDTAWAKVEKRLQRLHPEEGERGARDRLANAVVDLVVSERLTDPTKIAARAIRHALADKPPGNKQH